MRRTRWILLAVSTLILCTGCAHIIYERMKVGEFKGGLEVRWIKPDRFIYIPDENDPLRFKTWDNKLIEPKKMYTDGGSIPRFFWGVPGYSPWGYAPSYIIHDWLFVAHHCEIPDYKDVSFEDSARLLAEGIKTLMETKVAPRDETTLWAIYEAVNSPVAKSLWDNPGGCDLPEEIPLAKRGEPPGERFMRIDMNAVPKR
jgi:hypothetical protein